MSKQTQATLAVQGETDIDLSVTNKDRSLLRQLASKISELAARSIENEKQKLWYAHNSLKPTRPLIFCDPEHGWTEIFKDNDLVCEGERARKWEYLLRKEIFWGENMRDDKVIEPYFNIPYVYSESDWGMHEEKIGGEDGGAYTWQSPLTNYNKLDLLRFPKISIDRHATQNVIDLANDILGDLLQVRLKMGWWWSLGMTWTAINLRGLTQFMFDMVDYPAELHQLMAFLRDGYLSKLDFLEQNSLLFANSDGTYVGSGGFGWTSELPQKDFNGKVRCCDMWGFAESQETVGVSPEMFDEFIFQYQLPILKRFGLCCYGCCEPLDSRWEVVKRIPTLRRVSISPWSNVDEMKEKLQDKYILSIKPSPNDLAIDNFDEDRIRLNLRKTMKLTRNNRVEFIMKDNHTIKNDPTRVTRWVKIAEEEAESL